MLMSHPNNFWDAQVLYVYQTDTPFDCFPSLHAAASTICFYAWYRLARLKPRPAFKAIAIASGAIAVCIMLSTLLIKQHYIVDEISGFLLAWVVGHLLFNKFWEKFLPTKVGAIPPQEIAEV
jgi:membrane-associated phospholipid phosphatase